MRTNPTAETVPMDAKTLEALKGSIAKWEAIVAGHGLDRGPDNCPLCQAFLMAHDDGCDACPVAKAVGASGCSNTPFEDQWCALFPQGESYGGRANTPERKKAARAELDFLKSLLPSNAT